MYYIDFTVHESKSISFVGVRNDLKPELCRNISIKILVLFQPTVILKINKNVSNIFIKIHPPLIMVLLNPRRNITSFVKIGSQSHIYLKMFGIPFQFRC